MLLAESSDPVWNSAPEGKESGRCQVVYQLAGSLEAAQVLTDGALFEGFAQGDDHGLGNVPSADQRRFVLDAGVGFPAQVGGDEGKSLRGVHGGTRDVHEATVAKFSGEMGIRAVGEKAGTRQVEKLIRDALGEAHAAMRVWEDPGTEAPHHFEAVIVTIVADFDPADASGPGGGQFFAEKIDRARGAAGVGVGEERRHFVARRYEIDGLFDTQAIRLEETGKGSVLVPSGIVSKDDDVEPLSSQNLDTREEEGVSAVGALALKELEGLPWALPTVFGNDHDIQVVLGERVPDAARLFRLPLPEAEVWMEVVIDEKLMRHEGLDLRSGL